MISRRLLLSAPAAVAAGPAMASQMAAPTEACPSADDPPRVVDPFGMLGPEEDPVFGPALTGDPAAGNERTGQWKGGLVGASPPLSKDVATAFRLLMDAPRGTDPMVVARYFQALSHKDAPRGSTNEPFNAEWKGRANPLIISLFGMTNTRPAINQLNAEGDDVPWCAAFVSFCLMAAGRKSEYTALSGGYRRYGKAVDDPRPGDIAVFMAAGENGRRGKGHVGFFVRETPTHIVVLGGNQGQTVKESTYPKNDPSLRLLYVRRLVETT